MDEVSLTPYELARREEIVAELQTEMRSRIEAGEDPVEVREELAQKAFDAGRAVYASEKAAQDWLSA